MAFAEAAWRVVRAAVVRRRLAVVALGAFLAAVERLDVLRVEPVPRLEPLRVVERERAVAGLRVELVDLRAVVREAGLRAVLVPPDVEPVEPLFVVVVLLVVVFSAMIGVFSPSLGR